MFVFHKALAILLLAFIVVPFSGAYGEESAESTGPSGLPLPRFASLHTDEVNLRTGPGTRYPIEWVYRRENLPVEITAEFDIWRRIKDWEGSEGWVHKSNLWGKRTLIVTEENQNLYKSDSAESPVIAHVGTGSIGFIMLCKEDWCKVNFGTYDGYMQKQGFWGTYNHETFD